MRALLLAAAFSAAPAVAMADGAGLYKRCAACHLPNGAGVPGAYPPLAADFAGLARTEAGRRYLVLVVAKGVSGPITVGGRHFAGMMPAQSGLSDQEVAEVLNYVAQGVAKAGTDFRPFAAAEVRSVRASAAGLTPSDVGKLHAKVAAK